MNVIKKLFSSRPVMETPTPDQKPQAASIPFSSMGLSQPILEALREEGYTAPTPIQAACISHLVQGRDLLGCAQTGTGKTAAFALPTLQKLSAQKNSRRVLRALVLTPTRELAIQVEESFRVYGRNLQLRSTVVFGGVGIEPQKKRLMQGADILVATPGRLLDLYAQGFVDFSKLEILVLDEADRMLDMGFLPDVRRILKTLPPVRQNILFSATMPKDIQDLSMRLLRDPVTVEVAPVSSTSDQIAQVVYHVSARDKRDLLLQILEDKALSRVLVFTRTKAIANRTTKFLTAAGIQTDAIHGNKSQSARQNALERFTRGDVRVLVASDLAARGIDVDSISHVINFDLPNIAETYVHRIGRTGRSQARGIAISFCCYEERGYLRDIERIIGKKIPVQADHPYIAGADEQGPPITQGRGRSSGGGGGGRSSQNSNRGGSRGGSRGPQSGPQSGQNSSRSRPGEDSGGRSRRSSRPRGNR